MKITQGFNINNDFCYFILPETDNEWNDMAHYLFYKGSDSCYIQKKFNNLTNYKNYIFGENDEYKDTDIAFGRDEGLKIIKSIRKEKLNKIYASETSTISQ